MRLRVGPLLFCICVALYRAVWLSVQLSSLNAYEVGYLLLADVPVMGALGILMWVEAELPRPWRLLPLLLTIGLISLYLTDFMTVMALNARLQLGDVRRFAVEWWVLPSFVNRWSLIVLVGVVGCFFVRLSLSYKHSRLVPVVALLLVLLPLTVAHQSIPSHLHKYTGSVLLLGNELWGLRRQPISRYTPRDFAVYRGEYEALFDAPIARTGKNIILVIVESLSAADSYRTSGIRDILPRFDELSRKGMLFRNFLANSEASETGLVALVSGVPPLHFPTASTATFSEYAIQRSITADFTRRGYRCEFLTSVPLQFISMDRYTQEPLVGFSFAAGQKEIARYQGAPTYAFGSNADHLLYEEVLARLGPRNSGNQQPVLLVAVTASSHTPYVDPLGRANTAAHVWGYVQEELWWLYEELTKRGFFENGLLLITGDHRRMAPVQEKERERFGESAKARIPLVIIGEGVPTDVIDDRLFHQADLLRMLDRAVRPGADLSPFAVWVERYMYVFGVASNASSLQVFGPDDQARRGFRLTLRGAEIDWVTPPANALEVERSIHRQRASQQAERAARIKPDVLNFGRDLKPSDRSLGLLVGFSSDVNVSRDPDDPQGSLKMFTTDSLDVGKIRSLMGAGSAPFTVTVRGFLRVSHDGQYWFSVFSFQESCLAIDKHVVLGCQRGVNQGLALLTAGVHRLDFRFVHRGGKDTLDLKWLPPGAREFTALPLQTLLLPVVQGDESSR
jgi:lipoteichoic acid synthase